MSHGHEWGYSKENGPSTWANVAPAANGRRQSPIDIQSKEALFDVKLGLRPLKMRYVPANSKTIINNGHTVQVSIDGANSSLEGGPLLHEYQAAQFHLHWGKTNTTGSEHLVDGRSYPAELHIVHYNVDLFKNIGEAVKSEYGLAVLGMFVKIGKEHAGLKKMTDLLDKVKFEGEKVDLPNGLDISTLLPSDITRYWTYGGSLTTPPCFESVTWIVFKNPIEISEQQFKQLRELHSTTQTEGAHYHGDDFGGHIVENYRPPQPLYERLVRSSFRNS